MFYVLSVIRFFGVIVRLIVVLCVSVMWFGMLIMSVLGVVCLIVRCVCLLRNVYVLIVLCSGVCVGLVSCVFLGWKNYLLVVCGVMIVLLVVLSVLLCYWFISWFSVLMNCVIVWFVGW